MKTCPLCGAQVSELIDHFKLDEPVCYWCAKDLLDLNHPVPPVFLPKVVDD